MSSRAHLLLLGASLAACGTPVSGSGFTPFDAAADVPKPPIDTGVAVDVPVTPDVPAAPDVPVTPDVPAGTDVVSVTDVLVAQDVVTPPSDAGGRCARDGECASGQFCDDASGQCVAQRCVPNARQCVSGTRARICDNRGSTAIDADCASNQRCVEGQCLMNACTPNTTRCSDGVTRATCNAEGSMETASRCASGQRCAAGLCVAQVCTPGAARCTDGFTRSVCDVDGAMETATRCASGQRCATGGSCVAQACVPNAARCADGVTRAVCDSVGSQETSTRCAAGQRCSGGSCVAQACEPSATTCASSTRRRVCDAQGASFVDTECPAGANGTGVCSGGTCVVMCGAGYADCDGNAGNGCETGTLSNAMNCGSCGRLCFSGQSCVNGTCMGGTPGAAWSGAWGGSADDRVTGVALDALGNTAMLTMFSGAATVLGQPITPAGGFDAVLASVSPTGVVRWWQRIGGVDNDSGTAVAVDAAGNVYACGGVTGAVTLGGVNLPSIDGSLNSWVASWTADGTFRWARPLGGELSDQCLNLAVDGAGSVWALGNFIGTISNGSGTTPTAGQSDVYLARLNSSNGLVQGVRTYGGLAGDFSGAVAAHPTGGVVFAIHANSTGFSVGGATVTNQGNTDVLVVRVGAMLDFMWQAAITSANQESVSGLGCDSSGGVYLAGQTAGTTVNFVGTSRSLASNDSYVASLSATGALRWVLPITATTPNGSTELARGLHVAADGTATTVGTTTATNFVAGTVNVTGSGAQNAFVLSTSSTGVAQFARLSAASNGLRPLTVALSATRMVTGGELTGGAVFEGVSLARPGTGTDAWIANVPR